MTQYDSLADLVSRGATALTQGPMAVILAEDLAEIDSTLAHHLDRGFRRILLFAPTEAAPQVADDRILRIDHAAPRDGGIDRVVNALMPACAPGTWLYAGYNAEYLFHPFCEDRTVGEMLAFHAEERRDAMLAQVVDLYPGDLGAHPDGVSRADAHFDRTGYFATDRRDGSGAVLDRQLDLFGGLRWRFEDLVPETRRRIDRIVLFRARPGLRMAGDFTFNQPEYNTYACPWHHNLTCAVASFRTAKAFCANPASRAAITRFTWPESRPFDWSSAQLLDLGLMEPGQWF